MFLRNWLRPLRPRPVPARSRSVSRFIRLQLEGLEERITPAIIIPAADASQLQAAITTANTNPNQQYLIQLTGASPYNLTAQLAVSNTAGVTIAGSSTVLNAAPQNRVFFVSGGNLTLQNLTVEKGNVTGSPNGSLSAQGGGILEVTGALALTNVAVQSNVVQGSPGLNAQGGGVFVSGGTLSIKNSAIQGNTARGGTGVNGRPLSIPGGGGGSAFGGGIYVSGASVRATIVDSSFTNNLAQGGTGGNGGQADNGAGGNGGAGGDGQGGALYTLLGSVQMINTTLSGNTAAGGSGGNGHNAGNISVGSGSGGNGGNGFGGGVFDQTKSANSYINDTLAHNTASAGSGGTGGTPAGLPGTSGSANGGGINVNSSPSTFLNNLLEANTAATSGPDYFGPVASSETNNFISNASGATTFDVTSNILNNNTNQLGQLTTAPNGTSYYPLLPFVQSINHGTNSVLSTINSAQGSPKLTTDQIGNPRVVNGGIDIGAIEFQGLPTNIVVTNVNTPQSTANQNLTLSATVTSDGTTVNEGNVTFEVFDSQGNRVGELTGAPVRNGTANAPYTLPGGTPGGNYTITATYTDPVGGTFDSVSKNGTLAVEGSIPTSVAVSSVSVPFTSADPMITLHATVTTAAGGVVNEGQVQFVVTTSSGSSLGPAVTANVSNGQASASFAVPAETPRGNYTITAAYSDPSGHFSSVSAAGTLTVVTSSTTVVINNVSIVYGLFSEQETIAAVVYNALGQTVNEGFVTFSDGGQTATAPLVNSLATATLTIPLMAENPFPHSIVAAYGSTTGNFFASSSPFTLEQTLMDFLLQMMALEVILQMLSANP